MTTSHASMEDGLRQGFKFFNRFMLLVWRLGLGRWVNALPEQGGRIMVIVHTGRKTGRQRYTPVNYAVVDGEVYCTAGFGTVSDWYRNILVQPEVELWLPEGWWAGVAEDISDSPLRVSLMRQVLIGSGVVAPLVGIHPKQLTDAALENVTAPYRLVHIRRTAARTGEGGPGDLAWMWPLTTFSLLWVIFRRRR